MLRVSPNLLSNLAIGLVLWIAPAAAIAMPVLRVGITDGSQPCSYRHQGSWSGMAVELWQRIADQERLPYVLVPQQDTARLLTATRQGEVDVAIGCITVSPERLRSNRFTLPFQETGLGVMTRRSRLDLGMALLQALLAPDLIRLLLAYIAVIALLSLAVWQVERNGSRPAEWRVGRRRGFALIFQVLATGPGTNTVVSTARGHSVVFLAYLVRIVSASLLVSYVTVNVVRGSQETSDRSLRSLSDLAGERVGVRRGSVSDELLQALNNAGLRPPIALRELESIPDAERRLSAQQVDAVVADEIQLDFLLQQLNDRRYGLALRDLHPQSQAFALAPGLSQAIAGRINVSLGRLKRDGVVSSLRHEAIQRSSRPMSPPAAAGR